MCSALGGRDAIESSGSASKKETKKEGTCRAETRRTKDVKITSFVHKRRENKRQTEKADESTDERKKDTCRAFNSPAWRPCPFVLYKGLVFRISRNT